MKERGIAGAYNEPKKPKTTDSRHGGSISANLLKNRDNPTIPREVLVTDSTYIWSDEGRQYLATVMDLFSRSRHVGNGSALSKNNDTELVCKALWNASAEKTQSNRTIHHSDRGRTYCSKDYLNLLKQLNRTSSMRAKG